MSASIINIDFGYPESGEDSIAATGTTDATAYLLRRRNTVFSSVVPGGRCILPSSYSPGARANITNHGTAALTVSAGSDQIENYGSTASVAPGYYGSAICFDPPASPSPRTWHFIGGRVLSDNIVNVQDFGMLPSATAAQNTAAINTAIAVAQGMTLTGIPNAGMYIPAGVYLLNWFNLNFPIRIFGAGRATVLVLASGNPYSLINISQQWLGSDWYATNKIGSDVQIESLTLTAQSKTDPVGLNSAGGIGWSKNPTNPEYGRVLLRDVYIEGFPSDGFYADALAGFLVMDACIITNNYRHGLFLAYAYDARISKCEFGPTGGNSVNLYSAGTTKFVGCNLYGATLPVLNIYSDVTASEYGAGCHEFYGCSIGGGFQSAINYNQQNAMESARFVGCQIGNSGIGAPNTWPDVVVAITANNCLSFHSTEFQPIYDSLGLSGYNSNLNLAFAVGSTNWVSGDIYLTQDLSVVCETPTQFRGTYRVLGGAVPPITNETVTIGDNTNTSVGLALNGAANSLRGTAWQTAMVDRWLLYLANAETGSNAGGDWTLQARNDAGNFLSNPIVVTRETGLTSLLTLAINDPSTSDQESLTISATADTGDGAGLKMIGNGTITPSKILRVYDGSLSIVNDAGTSAILNLTDAGMLTIPSLATNSLLPAYANDAAAATGGISVAEFYWSTSVTAVVQRRA